MRREDAIKKLSKLLGKRLAWRVNPKAPDQDERDEAQAKLRELRPQRDALEAQRKERYAALLAGDAEYQRLKAEHAALKEQCDKLAIGHCYRFEAGTIHPQFGWFEIKAQGDSWEEVIAKLQKPTVTTIINEKTGKPVTREEVAKRFEGDQ